jgi:hypothetical protein
VSQLARAFQTADVEALTTLLTDDVVVSMPPTRANGQPAFGAYLRDPAGGVRHASGLRVLTLAGNRICGLTRFDNGVLPRFGLPRSLPGLEGAQG